MFIVRGLSPESKGGQPDCQIGRGNLDGKNDSENDNDRLVRAYNDTNTDTFESLRGMIFFLFFSLDFYTTHYLFVIYHTCTGL